MDSEVSESEMSESENERPVRRLRRSSKDVDRAKEREAVLLKEAIVKRARYQDRLKNLKDLSSSDRKRMLEYIAKTAHLIAPAK